MSARYALVKTREAMRRDFLPPEKQPAAYGYPSRRSPAPYRGLGREERDLYDVLSPDAPGEAEALVDQIEDGVRALSEVYSSLDATRLFASAFDDAEDYELLFLVPSGEAPEIPSGFRLIGYDVGYPTEEELFSAVSDLFFYPLWHGAAPARKEFSKEFAFLNDAGLFSDPKCASDFLAHYGAFFSEEDLLIIAVYAEND